MEPEVERTVERVVVVLVHEDTTSKTKLFVPGPWRTTVALSEGSE